MTDKEIINQWKHERELAECVCSYFVDQVELSLVNETIDLINRQKAEIERLQKLLDDKCDRCIARDKSEAIKEFAEMLKNKIKTECNPYGKPSFDYDTSIAIMRYIDNLVKEVLDDTPPADVVEVVRCKNCKFWDDDERCNGIKNGLILEYTNGYDYCSYGERKESNDR